VPVMTNEEKRGLEDCCEGRWQTATISEYCWFFQGLLLLLLFLVINLKQDIYNYTPSTNHISKVYCYSYSVLTVFATCSVMYAIESFYYYLFFITFMCGIYIYIPKTNHTTRVHSESYVYWTVHHCNS